MKDRIKRKNTKKVSHRLFRAMLSISFLTIVCGTLFTVLIVNINQENQALNKKIENYTYQIDLLDENDNQSQLNKKTD